MECWAHGLSNVCTWMQRNESRLKRAIKYMKIANNNHFTCQFLSFNLITSKVNLNILRLNLSQTSNSTPNSNSRSSAQTVSSSSNGLLARLAVPDSNTWSLDSILSAERAMVSRVLWYLNFAHELTEGGSVAGSVLSRDSDLLCTLSHYWYWWSCLVR